MNAMVQVAQRMTADEYLAAPLDERRTELVEGEVIVHLPLNLHQFVLLDLTVALSAWTSAAADRCRGSLAIDVALRRRREKGGLRAARSRRAVARRYRRERGSRLSPVVA